ncbi:MAG: CoA transferase [Chloroflexi bacterium]|nr:MAG: CoA transferase [Chloroflexota bacterium]
MLHPQRVRARQRGLVRGLRGNACRRVETERGPDRPLGHVLGAPPLAGIRVVEIGNYMAGPFCGMQLADLGADVVKVEHPKAGDLARLLEPLASGESGNFARLNRDKRSLAIDLKREEGREVFKRLAGRADVIVENLRPGTMDDLGLSPASLLQANARLVYVAVTGWGLDGPYADRPALDIIVQGQSGLMSITGEEGGVPVKVGVSIADLTAALYATIATLAALRARERDGRGQLVDISMFESAVSLAVWEAGIYFGSGEVPRAAGSAHKLVAPYQAVAASDRHFIVGATTPPNWKAFCGAVGLGPLEADRRFVDANARLRNREELVLAIEKVTRTKPAEHWLALLREGGVPCGEIADYSDVFNDEHLLARKFFVDLEHPVLGTLRGLGSPMRLGRTPVRHRRAGPRLGEHSAEVLRELGLGDADMDDLASAGIIARA